MALHISNFVVADRPAPLMSTTVDSAVLKGRTPFLVNSLTALALPQGAKVLSDSVSGGSSFSANGKLVVQLNDGAKKQYFMKV